MTAAAVKARLDDLPDDVLPGGERGVALQAARTQARKDVSAPMDQQSPDGLSLEEQRRAELVRAQEQQAVAARLEAAEAIRQEQTQRAEQIAREDAQKQREIARIAGLAREAGELAKVEAGKLDQLRDSSDRAAAWLAAQERQAEDARRWRSASVRSSAGWRCCRPSGRSNASGRRKTPASVSAARVTNGANAALSMFIKSVLQCSKCGETKMADIQRLTDSELAAARRNRIAGEASLACEGLFLNAEESAMFDRFERERLPHDERRRQLIAYSRARRQAKAQAAE